MNRLYYILPLLLLPLVLAQPPTTWKLPFSIYRLIYNFTLTQNATDLYVHVVIPTNIIDQYLTYWQSKGINVSQFPELLIPRVYYYNEITGQEVMVQNQITCLSTYRGYCHNFTIYFSSLPAGTHYITIYMPAFFWEDFEDNILNTRISNVGECFNDGWCIVKRVKYHNVYAIIKSPGKEPTPYKRLHVHVEDDDTLALKRVLNISINPLKPPIAKVMVDRHATYTFGCTAALDFVFLLDDGSKVTLRYNFCPKDFYFIETSTGCTIHVNPGAHTLVLLKDLYQYCNIPSSRVKKLVSLCIVLDEGGTDMYNNIDMYIDNIQISPAIEA